MPRSVPPGSQSVMIAGVEQHFTVAGRGPYCIVHSGGPGIASGYLRLPLLEEHLTMIYLDPIGTGRSGQLPTHPMGYTVDRFAEQVLGLVDALDLGRVYLLGHSHGAFVALQAAIRRPDVVAGLILHAGAAYTGGDFMAGAGKNVAAFVERYAGTPEADAVQRGWASIPSIRTDEAYTAALRNLLPVYFADHHRSRAILAELSENLRATMLVGDAEPFDVREHLPDLAVPALVMAGTHDFILGPRHAHGLMERLPNARLVQFDRSGHFAHLEQADAFADAVIAFLSGAA